MIAATKRGRGHNNNIGLQRQKQLAKAFNDAFPVGTLVRYWRGAREGRPSGTGVTYRPAEMLSGHTAVVWIEGCSGAIGLTHVQVLTDRERAEYEAAKAVRA